MPCKHKIELEKEKKEKEKSVAYIFSEFLNPVRSKIWVLSFDQIIGSILIFLKNQNDVILVKKQKSTSYNRVFNRILPGQPEFWFFLFFLTRPGSSPGSTHRAGFQNYLGARLFAGKELHFGKWIPRKRIIFRYLVV